MPLVHVVDDDEAIRESLALLLESSGQPARTYCNAETFLAALDPAAPGCVVTDVRMGSMSGLELQRVLRDRGIGLPVIIITGHGEVAMAVQALKDGAVDFIEKPFDEDVFLASVRSALDHGRQAFDERRQTADLQARAATMTAREREVMDLVVRGLANKSVAIELAISVRTVEIHRARVMEKMAVKSLSELVRAALRLEEGQ